MKDLLTVKRIDLMHPLVRHEVHRMYEEMCDALSSPFVKLRFSDTLRSVQKQNNIYRIGRSRPGRKVTWVKGGYSYHNYGLAFDIVLLIDKDRNGSFETASWNTLFDGDNDGVSDWLEVAKIAHKYGWKWGLYSKTGRHYDLPHFQKTFGYKTTELLRLPKDQKGYPLLN